MEFQQVIAASIRRYWTAQYDIVFFLDMLSYFRNWRNTLLYFS